MSPMHGPRIIGQDEYDRQVKAEAEQVAIHGGPNAMYGPRILDAPAQPSADALNGGETVATEPAPRLTIADLTAKLEAEPASLPSLAAAELASDAPRKGALMQLLIAARQQPDESELVTLLTDALNGGGNG